MRVTQIEGLSSDGDGVGRLEDGRVVFVPDAFPGDRVSLRIVDEKQRVAHGEVIDHLEHSRARVESRCKREKCGGCVWRALDADAQREAKRDRVVETLRRIGKVELQVAPPVEAAGEGWEYRHRVRLHAHYAGDHWQLGFYARRSHALVPLVRCPVLWPELERVCIEIAQHVRDLPEGCHLQDIDVVYSRRDHRAAALIRCAGPIDAVRERFEDFPALAGVEARSARERFCFGRLRLRYDHARADEYAMLFEPGTFTQANPTLNDLLVAAVLEHVHPQSEPRVLELHAGIGNFSLPLARGGASLVAVEQNTRSAILNRRNASNAGVRVNVLALSDAEALTQLRNFDTVLLDPPRTGAKEAAALVAKSGASRVVYVSCDPATLARDVATMQRSGFVLKRLRVFDMFPETPHVESLVVLER